MINIQSAAFILQQLWTVNQGSRRWYNSQSDNNY